MLHTKPSHWLSCYGSSRCLFYT